VKALYDYTATIDEEFDFQAGDIIAVTTCSDDGWWNGALLVSSRRVVSNPNSERMSLTSFFLSWDLGTAGRIEKDTREERFP